MHAAGFVHRAARCLRGRSRSLRLYASVRAELNRRPLRCALSNHVARLAEASATLMLRPYLPDDYCGPIVGLYGTPEQIA
jgi:hypothetical protein